MNNTIIQMKKFLVFIRANIINIILIQVIISILGSLYFSDIKGYEPCILCWYQRICMYSLFPIIIIAKINVLVGWFMTKKASFAIVFVDAFMMISLFILKNLK